MQGLNAKRPPQRLDTLQIAVTTLRFVTDLSSMAANQPPLQYALQTDADLEIKLCEKGLKGEMCLTCQVSLQLPPL